MWAAAVGVIASRSKPSDTLAGGQFLVPVLLSESPNSLRGPVTHLVDVALSVVPSTLIGQAITVVDVNLKPTSDNDLIGSAIQQVPVAISNTDVVVTPLQTIGWGDTIVVSGDASGVPNFYYDNFTVDNTQPWKRATRTINPMFSTSEIQGDDYFTIGGKWYFEMKVTTLGSPPFGGTGIRNGPVGIYYQPDGNITSNGAGGGELYATTTPLAEGDIIMIAIDMTTPNEFGVTDSVWFGLNGTWLSTPGVDAPTAILSRSGATVFVPSWWSYYTETSREYTVDQQTMQYQAPAGFTTLGS